MVITHSLDAWLFSTFASIAPLAVVQSASSPSGGAQKAEEELCQVRNPESSRCGEEELNVTAWGPGKWVCCLLMFFGILVVGENAQTVPFVFRRFTCLANFVISQVRLFAGFRQALSPISSLCATPRTPDPRPAKW